MLNAIQFSSFSEFLNMGGYAFNVWSVYGLFTIFLGANLLVPMFKKKQILKDLKRRRVVNKNARPEINE
ncbi:MAG TPA: heme exporter protein CcmD [Porticoccaceae bacterium]|nr:heme exporter protein CcmD [Gammaproteobacteria bacterium]HIL60446.1 heme exporter protein CcmD [Porticoccaceae bacterium]